MQSIRRRGFRRNSLSRHRAVTASIVMAGAAAIAAAGVGGVSGAAPTNPLVALGSWPAMSLTASSAGNQDLVALQDAARAAQERATRDGGRTGLDAKLAEQAVKLRQAELARMRQALIESKWEAQRAASAQGFVLPTYNYDITAQFGNSGRLWARNHSGLDMAAPAGTAVRAVSGGRVVEAGWAGAYGWRIRVKHWNNTETWYCHLSEMLVTNGTVEAGERIGRVGSTGNSTGPHLHFEVRPNSGDAIDPEPWLASRGLDARALEFRADRDLPEWVDRTVFPHRPTK